MELSFVDCTLHFQLNIWHLYSEHYKILVITYCKSLQCLADRSLHQAP